MWTEAVVSNGDEYIEGWYGRLRGPVTDALAYLADCETAPTSDGVLGEWVDTLRALRFGADDVPFIAQLIDKHDVHLQEAGVRLAHSTLRYVDATAAFTPPLTRLVSREIDPWVLESLIDLLAYSQAPFDSVYEGLARIHRQPPKGFGIARNRHIDPWRRVVQVYESNAIQTLRPRARDMAVLPILEREHGTRGWEPTLRAILVRMGYDADLHFQRLRTLV